MTQLILTRRRFVSLGLCCSLVGAIRAADSAAASGSLIDLRGTQLYVEQSGPRQAPALLYLHGGPGTGGYDFSLFQQQPLSSSIRVIVIDQRGVLRSGAIGPGEPFGFEDLIEDCEALRHSLKLERWDVLGHSFGGYLALAYGLKYPHSISRLVFENPTWDFNSSGRYLLRREAVAFKSLGRDSDAKEALKIANSPVTTPTSEVWQGFTRLTNELGKNKDDLYVRGPHKQFFSIVVANSDLSDDVWQRGLQQQRLLYREGKVFVSLTPRLGELKVPSLLIKGLYDPVTAPDQVAADLKRARDARLVVFENSAHFAHVEEAARFANVVQRFVLTGRPPTASRNAGWNGVPAS